MGWPLCIWSENSCYRISSVKQLFESKGFSNLAKTPANRSKHSLQRQRQPLSLFCARRKEKIDNGSCYCDCTGSFKIIFRKQEASHVKVCGIVDQDWAANTHRSWYRRWSPSQCENTSRFTIRVVVNYCKRRAQKNSTFLNCKKLVITLFVIRKR